MLKGINQYYITSEQKRRFRSALRDQSYNKPCSKLYSFSGNLMILIDDYREWYPLRCAIITYTGYSASLIE